MRARLCQQPPRGRTPPAPLLQLRRRQPRVRVPRVRPAVRPQQHALPRRLLPFGVLCLHRLVVLRLHRLGGKRARRVQRLLQQLLSVRREPREVHAGRHAVPAQGPSSQGVRRRVRLAVQLLLQAEALVAPRHVAGSGQAEPLLRRHRLEVPLQCGELAWFVHAGVWFVRGFALAVALRVDEGEHALCLRRFSFRGVCKGSIVFAAVC